MLLFPLDLSVPDGVTSFYRVDTVRSDRIRLAELCSGIVKFFTAVNVSTPSEEDEKMNMAVTRCEELINYRQGCGLSLKLCGHVLRLFNCCCSFTLSTVNLKVIG